METISIIVPVYKVEKYINRCIDSILKQSYPFFELILVDDGSPDQCGNICDVIADNWNHIGKHISKIIVIHQKNGGLSAARNTGIEWVLANSTSNWITFIDSDDWIHPDYLKLLLQAATEMNSAISIAEHVKVSDYSESLNITNSIRPESCNTEEYWIENRTNATTAWGKLYRKDFFQTIRYPIGKYHEDEYVTYKLLFQNDKIAVVKAPLYFYFYNQASISRLDYMKRYPDLKEVFALHYDFFKNTNFKRVFRMETVKYAETMSYAIWDMVRNPEVQYQYNIQDTRNELKEFLKTNKHNLPFEDNKAVYIAAYPKHEFFIRVFGFIKSKLNTIIRKER